MARKREPKSGISHGSNDPEDRLLACLNYGVNVGSAAYLMNPDYFSACARWFNILTPAQQETVSVVIDAYTHARRDAAKAMAAQLPPAPKCPL